MATQAMLVVCIFISKTGSVMTETVLKCDLTKYIAVRSGDNGITAPHGNKAIRDLREAAPRASYGDL